FIIYYFLLFFFFSSRRRHTRFDCDWSSDVCSSDLYIIEVHFDTEVLYYIKIQSMEIGKNLQATSQRIDIDGEEKIVLRMQPYKRDRKSTRLNSSHSQISYAVFCLKKKKEQ